MLSLSSFLAHYALAKPRGMKRETQYNWPTEAGIARRLSIVLRRGGKVIATFNAFWILVSCFFQFSSFFDRCYCNSSVFGRRHLAYNVIEPIVQDITAMKAAWIGGVCLAASSAAIFIGFVNLYIDPPLPEERR